MKKIWSVISVSASSNLTNTVFYRKQMFLGLLRKKEQCNMQGKNLGQLRRQASLVWTRLGSGTHSVFRPVLF